MNSFIITVKDGFEEKALKSFSRSMGLKIAKSRPSTKPIKETGYTRPGKPVSVSQYKGRLNKARQLVEEGNYTSHDDLKKETGEW
jgi:hypothetical protein